MTLTVEVKSGKLEPWLFTSMSPVVQVAMAHTAAK